MCRSSEGASAAEDLVDGIHAFWGSPQVLYQPVVDGDEASVTLAGSGFPLRRLGVGRIEVPVSFTEVAAQAVQGQ